MEIHVIQNFAPSNLNRDDTGAPKSCEFGGYPRARVSSQCFKRAIREHFKRSLPGKKLGVRTRLLRDALVEKLAAAGKDKAEATRVAELLLQGAGLAFKEAGRTQYLLFVGHAQVDALAKLAEDHWDTLAGATGGDDDESKTKKQKKKAAAADVKKLLGAKGVKALEEALWSHNSAVDIALFGRMIADRPERNVDAACQVAHAISVNSVTQEHDFFTAVDDFQGEESSGAGMMGMVGFNSACHYRYLNVDLAQLAANLGGDEELAKQALEALLHAVREAVPTGKQNSFAAQNPPSFFMVVAGDGGFCSLANAFEKPVRPSAKHGLVERAIAALDDYWGRLAKVYGDGGEVHLCTLHEDVLVNLKGKATDFDGVVKAALATARFD